MNIEERTTIAAEGIIKEIIDIFKLCDENISREYAAYILSNMMKIINEKNYNPRDTTIAVYITFPINYDSNISVKEFKKDVIHPHILFINCIGDKKYKYMGQINMVSYMDNFWK